MIKHITQKLVCLIPRGLTVTNSALIAKIANTSDSRVTVECRGNIYSAHKLLGLLSIGLKHGDPFVISACGQDAEDTLKSIGTLFEERVSHYWDNQIGLIC